MTRSVADLLVVYLLGKEVGLTRMNDQGMECVLPVVPLFETFEDLEAAPAIIEDFFPSLHAGELVGWRAKPISVIMLGYSDSNKDTGIIASQWALQRAQKRLLEIGTKYGVSLTFFHGRGGTVGRGAGPTHRFLEALPEGSLAGGLRLTEQGEVIGQKFNTATTASSNLETLLAGSLGAQLLSSSRKEPAEIVDIMDCLAESSRLAYRELLESDGFVEFYRQATPIDGLSGAGSARAEQAYGAGKPAGLTGDSLGVQLESVPLLSAWLVWSGCRSRSSQKESPRIVCQAS